MKINLTLNQKIIASGVAALVLIAIIIGGYLYYQSTQKGQVAGSQSQEEARKLVDQIGKLVELPAGEDPTVATVTDVERLREQPFFQRAENGDKVLIYTNAKKAILYRPSQNKVIDIAPINIGSPSAETTSPSPTPTSSPEP
ncbi:hypothetical protein HYS94_03570 [Candidatus Daviesbacteria bacterium]|nr:hypothetical protein [Candidatus Daviesbacteria bacterium]